MRIVLVLVSSLALLAGACGSGGGDREIPDGSSGVPDAGVADEPDAAELPPDGGQVVTTRLYPGPCVVEGIDLPDELDFRVSFTYDVEERPVESLADLDGDGTDDLRSTNTFAGALLVQTDLDFGPDGDIEEVQTWSYDAEGHAITAERDWGSPGEPADGVIDQRVTHVWQGGLLVRSETDNAVDGTIDRLVTFTYYPDGRLELEDTDADNDGAADERDTWTYDDPARLTHVATDVGVDGDVDELRTLERDADGRVIREDIDQFADGTIWMRTLYGYDDFGNPLREESDFGNDGFLDYLVRYGYACFEP